MILLQQVKKRLEESNATQFRSASTEGIIEFYAPENPLLSLFVDTTEKVFIIRCRPISDTEGGIDYQTKEEKTAFDVFNYLYTITLMQRKELKDIFAL